ncbi:MAG: proline dehydrogenase family protein [Flavobacteriales bacterium]
MKFSNTEIAFRSKTNGQLKKAYLLFKLVGNASFTKLGKVMTNLAIKLRLPLNWIIKPTIFEQFCGGETIAECASTTKVLDEYGIGTILDYSVEGKTTEDDFDATMAEIKRTVRAAADNEHIPFCVFKITGIGRFSVLEAVNDLSKATEADLSEFKKIKNRVDEICSLAYETGTPVFIDAEESWIQDTIDRLAEEMMATYNKDKAVVYNTVQLYRHDRLAYLKTLYAKSKAEGFICAVKLVRGAYMEKERDRAEEKGYPSPIQPDKAASDRDFDLALEYCVANIEEIAFCAGTHNEDSSAYLAELLTKKGIEKSHKHAYFAQLYGMSDHISFNLSEAGYRVAKYVPYGPVKEVLPYLIRRADENTSMDGQMGRELGLIKAEMERRKG